MRCRVFKIFAERDSDQQTLEERQKQQELNSDFSQQVLVQLLSHQWSCRCCWQMKRLERNNHISLSRGQWYSYSNITSLFATEVKSCFKNKIKKEKSEALLPASRLLACSPSSEIPVLSVLPPPSRRCNSQLNYCNSVAEKGNLHYFLRSKYFFLSLPFWRNRINLASWAGIIVRVLFVYIEEVISSVYFKRRRYF